MDSRDHHTKKTSVFRCPDCRQISPGNEWLLFEDNGKVKCPKCLMLSSIKGLKRIQVEHLERGRIWVNIDRNVNFKSAKPCH